jgi:dipeptidyl aminopeptidase/acylaminoacyl peptidase
LKCLEKEPQRRYGSAEALALDLERYLQDQPIRARRPTLVQRVQKWMRRHRAIVWTAGLSLVAMLVLAVIGLAASNVLILREKAQTDAAKEQLERTLYYQRIALAHRDLTAIHPNPALAEELLQACPLDRRGWEWDYLKRLRHKMPLPLHHDSIVFSVDFSPDGQYLASGCRDGLIKVWDAHTGQPHRSFRASARIPGSTDNMVFSVAFSPNGKRLAAACSDGSVQIWDLLAGQKALEWTAHGSPVDYVRFSPDGRRLASMSASFGWEGQPPGGEIKVWDAATGKEALTLDRATMHGSRLAFSPDGRRLASAEGYHKTVKVWDTMTGRELVTCRGHTGGVLAVAFSPDGQSLASASGNWNQLAHGRQALGCGDRPGNSHTPRSSAHHQGPGLQPGRPTASHGVVGPDGPGLGRYAPGGEAEGRTAHYSYPPGRRPQRCLPS